METRCGTVDATTVTVPVIGYTSFASKVGFSGYFAFGRRNHTICSRSRVMWVIEDRSFAEANGKEISQGKERPMPTG